MAQDPKADRVQALQPMPASALTDHPRVASTEDGRRPAATAAAEDTKEARWSESVA